VGNDLKDTIQENATGPKKATGDSGSVEQHGLQDQIAVDRYLASKRAMRTRTKGLILTKLVPPGAA
jgi:hypothetical protein